MTTGSGRRNAMLCRGLAFVVLLGVATSFTACGGATNTIPAAAPTSPQAAAATTAPPPATAAPATAAPPTAAPPTAAPQAAATTAPQAAVAGNVKRGEYLAWSFACVDCHSQRQADGVQLAPATLLAGGEEFRGPWGLVHSSNVIDFVKDSDPAVIERTIRGQERYLIVMPTFHYNLMAKQDMQDLIAYLLSLKPANYTPPSDERDPAFNAPPPLEAVAVPDIAPAGRTLERGQYLAVQAGCEDCHTPRGPDRKFDQTRALAGGSNTFAGPGDSKFYGPNLTPDKETGLGAWTDAEIAAAIREGKGRDGTQLHPAMPYASAYHLLTDDDVAALVLYLRSLPPLKDERPANPVWKPNS